MFDIEATVATDIFQQLDQPTLIPPPTPAALALLLPLLLLYGGADPRLTSKPVALHKPLFDIRTSLYF